MSKKVKNSSKNSKNLHNKFNKGAKSNSSTNPNRKIQGNTSGTGNSLRTMNTIKRLKLYNQKMPSKQKLHERPTEAARVDPNRKWFGNVRTIDQKSLQKLRIEMMDKDNDPTKIFVKAKKLPKSLLSDPVKENKVRLLEVETFAETFGPSSRRKKVKIGQNSLEEMVEETVKKEEVYQVAAMGIEEQEMVENRDKRMSAGQSKRIWDQLHKVIDSSDVLVQVLDARDPDGTRSLALEELLKKNFPHKHLVLLLNKADLIPVWVIKRWVKHLSKQFPTIAFKASITNPFGKGSLINLFRQFDMFHRDKKHISIGFVGYPNVGKSSVINCLKDKVVCKAAPVPGETKVWQYITLTKRIYLIDCPGTVHHNEGKNDIDSVLKGCVRAERINDPSYYVDFLLQKVKDQKFLKKKYRIPSWEDSEDFLKQCAIKKGKLKKGGEPDVEATAKLILIDWQRGNIPYHSLPEGEEDHGVKDDRVLDQVKEEEIMPQVIIQEEEEEEEEKGQQ